MKILGDRNYALIEIGAKGCGTYEPCEILPFFEEQLYIDEAEEVTAFLQWCHDNDKAFGHGNYEERFAEFKAATAPDAGKDYEPGSGEYNDMMFGDSPDS